MPAIVFSARRAFVPALLLGIVTVAGTARARQDLAPGFEAPPGGSEVLTRGPIHEAFATPVIFNPTTMLVIPKPPPQTTIEEVPPAQKPAGADVEWIPGYWAWDDDRNDFIWISGVWRDIPPGRQWIPGYWIQVNGGYGWTAGFWAPEQAEGPVDYLPAPPASLENGPNSPAPGPNFAWAPGSWVWQADRYAWQPGYWYESQPNWVWTPACYQSTPGGYVYNQGYWDYSLDHRGLPFAPLAFNNAALPAGPATITPNFVLPTAGLLASLFVRPNYGHYYYGDYYAAANGTPNARYVPWFGFRQNKVGYDPIYATMAAQNGRQANWDQRYRDDFRYRVDHQEARPLPTFAAQRAFIDQRHARGEDVRNLGFVEPFGQWARNPNAGQSIVAVDQDHRRELQRRQSEMINFQKLRANQEEQGKAAATQQNLRAEGANRALFRNELPRSPIAAAGSPRFASRGLAAPPATPPGQNPFRPSFGGPRPEIPTISHREPKANRPPGPDPRPVLQQQQREAQDRARQEQLRKLQGEQAREAQQKQAREAQKRQQEQAGEAQKHQQERTREAAKDRNQEKQERREEHREKKGPK